MAGGPWAQMPDAVGGTTILLGHGGILGNMMETVGWLSSRSLGGKAPGSEALCSSLGPACSWG